MSHFVIWAERNSLKASQRAEIFRETTAVLEVVEQQGEADFSDDVLAGNKLQLIKV